MNEGCFINIWPFGSFISSSEQNKGSWILSKILRIKNGRKFMKHPTSYSIIWWDGKDEIEMCTYPCCLFMIAWQDWSAVEVVSHSLTFLLYEYLIFLRIFRRSQKGDICYCSSFSKVPIVCFPGLAVMMLYSDVLSPYHLFHNAAFCV